MGDDRYYNGRGYRNQNYEQGYRNQGGYRDRGDRPVGKAGTGAFLDSRRLRGDEIDVKDQQEFDFESANKDFGPKKTDEDMGALAEAMDSMALEAQQQQASGGGKAENADDDNGKNDEEDTKTSGDTKYDKNKSFFDGLDTETKKSKPRADMQTQKDVDTSTFGSVAATYKSRHITRNKRPGQGRNNYYQGQGQRMRNGGGYDQRGYQRGYDQRGGQRRDYQSYNRQQDRANGGYRNRDNRDNRWVQKN